MSTKVIRLYAGDGHLPQVEAGARMARQIAAVQQLLHLGAQRSQPHPSDLAALAFSAPYSSIVRLRQRRLWGIS